MRDKERIKAVIERQPAWCGVFTRKRRSCPTSQKWDTDIVQNRKAKSESFFMDTTE